MITKFRTLWDAHPVVNFDENPCTTGGKINFDNQCAIRMGECFDTAGISLATFRGARCYSGHGHGSKHILRVEELGKWMAKMPATFGEVTVYKKVKSTDFATKTGIAMFRNFWGVGNQGDHIDLWNGYRMTKGSPDYFDRSQEVWFWEIL